MLHLEKSHLSSIIIELKQFSSNYGNYLKGGLVAFKEALGNFTLK
jgi:hypothetical protein